MRSFAVTAATAFAGAAIVAVGCTKVESSSIKTAGMSAQMSVSADGTGKTVASASLHVDENATDYVDLSPGDTLTASSGGKSQSMSRSNVLGIISYTTEFSGLDAADTPFTIAFSRANDTSAPSSTVTLPGPYKITTPTSNASFSRATNDVTVTWDLTGKDPMTYEVTGPCLKTIFATSIANDPGTVTIAKGTILPSDPNKANDTCQATVTLRRTRAGKLDSAFGHGGNVTAQQTRSITFASTP